MYPNPANDFVNVNTDGFLVNGLINIYNVNGKIILSQAFNNNTKVDVSNFIPGIYMIEFTADSITCRMEKIVVQ